MLWAQILAGAMLGGVVGVLFARGRLCGGGRCNVKGKMIAHVIAFAVLGAAVAFAIAGR